MMVNLPEAESNNKLFVESYLALFVDNKRYSIVICPNSTPFCFGRLSFFRIVQFKSKLRDLMLGSILFVPFPKIHAVQTDRICPETESFNRFYLILITLFILCAKKLVGFGAYFLQICRIDFIQIDRCRLFICM